MKKQSFFTILIILLMSLVGTKALAYDMAAENADGVTIYYNYINDGKELEVTSGSYSGTINIPEEVTFMNRTRKVTRIGRAFYFCRALHYVRIPNNVTSIEKNAFTGCSGLISFSVDEANASYKCEDGVLMSKDGTALIVYPASKAETTYIIPNSVISIEECAFYRCINLTSVTIGNSLTSIGGSAFSESSITTITIGNNVTSIGAGAFHDCTGLTSLTIPNSVTIIGGGAFQSCSGIKSVTIGNSVTSIGDNAFEGCSSLTSITIGNNVTSIGDNAFSICSSLTTVTIPNSVMSIGNGAFCQCSSLTSITIPNSVTSIGGHAFWLCKELTSITIPNSVKYIGWKAFSGCSSLTSITIPNSITSIEENVFENCTNLTFVTIPNSVTSIGGHVFEGCSNLTSITIPNSVKSIGDYAFRGCNLTSITIPNSVTKIGDYAFYGYDIQEVISKIENPFDINSKTFSINTFSNASLYVPIGTITKYKAKEGWKKFVFIEEDGCTLLPGDSNNDGKVNVADIVEIHNAMVGEASASFNLNNADMDGDGYLTEADIDAIVNIILEKGDN